jgi:hypothetical protein
MRYAQQARGICGAVAALAGAAGLAYATVFTFTPQCGNTWYQECLTTACPTGGWNTYNNWNSQHACSGGLPTPGIGDDVVLPALTLRQNGSVSVNSMAFAPGATYEWDGGDLAIATPFTQGATLNVHSGYKHATGAFTNTGTWNFADGGGFTMYFQGLTFTNSGAVNQANMHINQDGGTNLFTNNGTYIKNHPSGTVWTGVPIVNTGVIRAATGTQSFTSAAISSMPGARWEVLPSGAIVFHSCTLAGTLAGDNQATMGFNTLSLGGPLTLNITGNGFAWASGNVALAGDTLTNAATGRVSVGAGYKSAVGGAIVNEGEWTFADGGGYVLYFQDLSFTNAGTISQANMHINQDGGTNLFTNNGTYLKNHASSTNWSNVPVVNNGAIRADVGTQTFSSAPLASVPAARWDTGTQGAIVLNGDTLSGTFKGDVAGSMPFNSLTVGDGVTLDFSGAGLTWNSGGVAVPATTALTNAPTGLIVIPDNAYKSLTGSVVNEGRWTHTGAAGYTLTFHDATLVNTGEVDMVGMHWVNGSGANAVINEGLFRKGTGASVSISSLPVTNHGVFHVAAGTLSLSSAPYTQGASGETIVNGTLNINTNISIGAGRVSGAGAVLVPGGANTGLTNTGCTVAPGDGVGVLTIGGNYAQQGAGTLEIEIAGTTVGTGHDRLAVTGAATLAGTLRVLWPNAFLPTVGQAFTVLTTSATGRSGMFSAVDNTEPGYVIDVQYLPNGVVVSVVGVTCDSIDFNRDTLFPDTQDIDDYLAVFAGGPCPTSACGDVDFNNDGLLPDADDIQAFLRVFSGGSCS